MSVAFAVSDTITTSLPFRAMNPKTVLERFLLLPSSYFITWVQRTLLLPGSDLIEVSSHPGSL
jgi:hypothetical protein